MITKVLQLINQLYFNHFFYGSGKRSAALNSVTLHAIPRKLGGCGTAQSVFILEKLEAAIINDTSDNPGTPAARVI